MYKRRWTNERSPVHSYSPCFSETFVFSGPLEYSKPPFSKILLKKIFISMTENAVFVSTGGKNGGKSLRFRKYPDTCGRGLSTEMALMTDDNPEVPSHNPSMFIILWDVKEPADLSQRVGHVVPGVVVCLLWCIMVGRVNARRY